MELHTERQRRARNRPKQTTGVLVRTMHDARGIAEPLERYGELLACQIVGLYNAVHGLPATSRHTLARLKQLFHESEGLPATRQDFAASRLPVALRLQSSDDLSPCSWYRPLPLGSGIYDQDALGWAESTRIVQISADPGRRRPTTMPALSLVMASLEIAIRQCRELRFITHLDIIRNASAQAQRAANPLSIPVPALAHTFRGGRSVDLADIHLKPDALFGIQYPPADDPDFRFFALEYDRSTEDVEPTKNLLRSSWLRKVLSYSADLAAAQPAVRDIPEDSQICWCFASFPTHRARLMSCASLRPMPVCPEQFLFKTIAPVDPLLNAASLPQLLHDPWQRLGGTFNIRTLEERR